MYKKIICISILFLFICAQGYCQDPKAKLQDSMARGYLAITKDDNNSALDYFKKALDYAKEVRSWRGCIDSGYGLLSLGNPNEATKAFETAYAYSKSDADWRGCVASGYGFLSLPEELKNANTAKGCFKGAFLIAKSKKEYQGIVEATNGFTAIKDVKTAKEYIDTAFEIAKKDSSALGLKLVSEGYFKAGYAKDAQQALGLSENIQNQRGEVLKKQPPAGWQPLGETVAGPPKIDANIQIKSRESADKEIQEKYEWIAKQKELEAKQDQYANIYAMYYDYPWGSRAWGYNAWTPGSWGFGVWNKKGWGWSAGFNLRNWANSYSRYYRYNPRSGLYFYYNDYGYGDRYYDPCWY